MGEEELAILKEIREMMKVIIDGQEKLMKSVSELKEEQKKLFEEVKSSNFAMNGVSLRGEVLN